MYRKCDSAEYEISILFAFETPYVGFCLMPIDIGVIEVRQI